MFLYFDLGNVLLRFDHRRACHQLARIAGVSSDRIWEAVFAGGLESALERGDLSRESFPLALADELACPVGDLAGWERAVADIFEPMEGMADLVADLHRADLRLGLLSNTNIVHWEFVSENHPWLVECFECHVLSYRVGAMKPHSTIYEVAERLAGCRPEEIFFVDDRLENVAVARGRGWDAVRFESPERLRQELALRGLIEGPAGSDRT